MDVFVITITIMSIIVTVISIYITIRNKKK